MLKTYDFFSSEPIKELDEDNVIAIPTDTVYGLAIKYDSQIAYKKLIAAKGRDPLKPISVMFASNYDYHKLLITDSKIEKVIKYFLPGALTIVCNARKDAPYQTHLNTYKIGFRITADTKLDDFLKRLSYPLQVTSANISGNEALVNSDDVIKTFENKNEVTSIILGKCDSKIATTVVDLSTDKPKLLREGQIPFLKVVEIYNS